MYWILLLLVLIALLNAGLLVWIGGLVKSTLKETIVMNEQETRLNAALDVLKAGVAQLVILVATLVSNNPDLSDETAAITKLGEDIQAAIETAQGGGTPDPIPPPVDPADTGGTGGGDTSGGGGSGDGGDTSSPGDTSGGSEAPGGSSGEEKPGEVI